MASTAPAMPPTVCAAGVGQHLPTGQPAADPTGEQPVRRRDDRVEVGARHRPEAPRSAPPARTRWRCCSPAAADPVSSGTAPRPRSPSPTTTVTSSARAQALGDQPSDGSGARSGLDIRHGSTILESTLMEVNWVGGCWIRAGSDVLRPGEPVRMAHGRPPGRWATPHRQRARRPAGAGQQPAGPPPAGPRGRRHGPPGPFRGGPAPQLHPTATRQSACPLRRPPERHRPAASAAPRVVFVCTANSARSQLAAATWNTPQRRSRGIRRHPPRGPASTRARSRTDDGTDWPRRGRPDAVRTGLADTAT